MRRRKSKNRLVCDGICSLLLTIAGLSSCFIATASGQGFGKDRASSVLVLEVRMVSEATKFKGGGSISISVLVRNVGKDVLILPISCQSLDYKLTVKDRAGRVLPLTPRGKKLTTPMLMVCPRNTRTLASGES